jgi:type VI secretion system Hcp family effector
MKTRLVTMLFVFCTVALFSASPAFAQADTFMLVPGILGDSIDKQHKDWIDVFSITQTFDPGSKNINPCLVEVGKFIDRAGPKLWLAAVTGQRFNSITIEFQKPGGDLPFKFYELKLNNAVVNSITSTPDALMERLTLIAQTLELTFITQKLDGTPGGAVKAVVDCR